MHVDLLLEIALRVFGHVQSVVIRKLLKRFLRDPPSAIGLELAISECERIFLPGSRTITHQVAQCKVSTYVLVLERILLLLLVARLINHRKLSLLSLIAPEHHIHCGSQCVLYVVLGTASLPDNGSNKLEVLSQALLGDPHLLH
jgi:hypothetical protein